MQKLIILIITICFGANAFPQQSKDTSLATKYGVLIFEGKKNVYCVYFIEFPPTQSFSFATSDTFKVINIGTPGCNAGDAPGFKDYLHSIYRFDSVLCIALDYDGIPIVDTCMLLFKRGYIKYNKSDPYKLAKSFEKKNINNKIVILETEDYIRITDFFSDPTKKKQLHVR